MSFIRALRAIALVCVMVGSGAAAPGQISDGVVRIGVLTELGSPGGRGEIVAAQMAAQDFGETVRDRPIEIVSSDRQRTASPHQRRGSGATVSKRD